MTSIFNMLHRAGLDTGKYDERTLWLMVQPSHNPECYFCDGEVTAKQAMAMWKRQLKRAGLSAKEIRQCVEANF